METIYIFIAACQNKTERREDFLLIHKKWKNNISNWQCIDEQIITVNINILKTQLTITGVYRPNEDEPVTNTDFFYETLQRVITDFGNNRELVLIGDFNARTGRSSNSNIIGRFGEEKSNENGARLIGLCEQNNLKITNGFLKHKEIYKFTWTQNTRNLKSIIDYVIVRQDSQVKTINIRVYRGPCCGTDYSLVKATFYVPPRLLMERLKNEKKNHQKCNMTKYSLYSLNDESTKILFQQR